MEVRSAFTQVVSAIERDAVTGGGQIVDVTPHDDAVAGMWW